MNAEQFSDDLVWDRLVDGELPEDQRRALIASLDDRPDGWRRCAVAFLEAQSLRQGMQGLVAELSVRSPVASPASTVAPRVADSSAKSHVPNWYAVAATILVAFGIGVTAGRPLMEALRGRGTLDGVAQDGRVVAVQDPQLLRDNSTDFGAGRVGDRDAVTLVVRDVTGTPRRLQVPLVDSPSGMASLPDPVREQFHENGVDLQVRRRYAPLFFENADGLAPLVVPVDDAVVTPVKHEIF